ncbi:hypothetical protein X011_23260 [Mycobacterium tuberculosis variant microti OV254]|nr:hypothetical protein X011_23260 [Mycobacterium tuberculosis variant microti OV254]BBX43514.1 hypothetical protein MSIM_49650 [Mycobacterium simiae]
MASQEIIDTILRDEPPSRALAPSKAAAVAWAGSQLNGNPDTQAAIARTTAEMLEPA